jgi:TDG/mug DNA glycosylase family protein
VSRPPRRPTPAELEAARGVAIPDVIADGLDVLFCGINPGLWSGATGHHFARPGNRFWPVLHRAGFTPRQLAPWEEGELLALGVGVTNLVPRTTAAAAERAAEELRAGAVALEAKAARHRPRAVAVVGMGAYRTAFRRPRATLGRQPEKLAGAEVWMLPNPSGLQARYQLPDLVAAFEELREALS